MNAPLEPPRRMLLMLCSSVFSFAEPRASLVMVS